MSSATDGGPLLGDLMTVAEVGTVLRVSNMTVYRLIRSGELPALRIGKGFRIQRQDLAAYLADGVVRVYESNG
jgi:excisionase family DNA binding protein